MKTGDLVRIVRHHFGNDQVRETGVVLELSYVSQGGFDVWTVFVNETGNLRRYTSGELRILNESR